MLCGKGFLAKCPDPHRSVPNLPRKSWSVPGLWVNARVRAAPRRFCREHRAPCWFLGKMLRSASSLQRKPCSCSGPRKTVLRFCATCLGPGRSAPDLPRKPCSVLGFSAIVDARVGVARLRFSRENRAWFLSSMLWVRAGPRQVCRENPAPRCVVVLYRDSTRSALWKFAEFAIS